MKNIYSALAFLFLLNISNVIAQTKVYTPELRSPANNAIGVSPDALLDWDAVTGPNPNIIYEVQLSESATFTPAITFPQTSLTALKMSMLKFESVYFWRVRALDGVNISDWSAAFSFRVVPTVTITAPLNQNTPVLMPNPVVRWNAITGISQYDIQIDTSYAWVLQAGPPSGTTPFNTQMNDVFQLDDNIAWAVGNGGVILRRNNNVWTSVPSSTTQNLNDVFFLDANNGWAVGAAGTVLYYNGTSWSGLTSGTTAILNGVYFTSSTNGYVVGAGGVVRRFDGSAWTAINVGFTANVNAIHGLNASNIWVAGASGNCSYFNGTSWSNVIVAANREIMGIWALSPTNVWAAAKAGRIYQFNGNAWVEFVSGTTRDLNDISFINANTGYIAGNNGTLLVFNGVWWQTTASNTIQNLWGIHMANASAGVMVGASGTIVSFRGGGFNSNYLKTISAEATAVETTLANLAFGKNHYIRMRAKHSLATSDWSAPRTFTIVSSPTLTQPADNATNIALDTLVKWGALTGVVRYGIQLSTNSTFSDPFNFESNIAEFRFTNLSFGRDYFWRVNARHASGVSAWSTARKFTTTNAISLSVPANNATAVSRLPRFSWVGVKGVERYHLQFGKDNTFITKTDRISTASFFQTVFMLDPQATYFWRVRGIVGLDSSNWSTVRSFLTTNETSVIEQGNQAFNISPNPNIGLFDLSLGQYASRVEMEVYNLIGKKVYSEVYFSEPGSLNKKFDLQLLGKGVFLIKLNNGNQQFTKKLIIE